MLEQIILFHCHKSVTNNMRGVCAEADKEVKPFLNTSFRKLADLQRKGQNRAEIIHKSEWQSTLSCRPIYRGLCEWEHADLMWGCHGCGINSRPSCARMSSRQWRLVERNTVNAIEQLDSTDALSSHFSLLISGIVLLFWIIFFFLLRPLITYCLH